MTRDPTADPEGMHYIPCCCETKPWFGRKSAAAPLTDSFIRSAAAAGQIVPPHTGLDGSVWPLVLGALATLGLCAASIWAVLRWVPV